MRVILLGNGTFVQRVDATLTQEGIEVVSAFTSPQTESLLAQETFDLAMVDTLIDDVEAACRSIRDLQGIPVALMVRERQQDWERLQALDADGYVPEVASDAEQAARLRAVVRRFSGWRQRPARGIRKGGGDA